MLEDYKFNVAKYLAVLPFGLAAIFAFMFFMTSGMSRTDVIQILDTTFYIIFPLLIVGSIMLSLEKRESALEAENMTEDLYTRNKYSSTIIKTLGDSPKLRIVGFFLDNPLFNFKKKEVIEALGMSKQTFYKYFPELEEYEIVKVSRRIGKAKLYRINPEHPLVTMLREYKKKASLQIANKEASEMQKPIPAEA